MNNISINVKILLMILISVLPISCTSYKTINTSDQIKEDLHRGDTVKIIMKDGSEHIFKVEDYTSEAIIGEDQRVLIRDIARVEKRQISAGKTAALGGGIIAGGFLSFILGVVIILTVAL